MYLCIWCANDNDDDDDDNDANDNKDDNDYDVNRDDDNENEDRMLNLTIFKFKKWTMNNIQASSAMIFKFTISECNRPTANGQSFRQQPFAPKYPNDVKSYINWPLWCFSLHNLNLLYVLQTSPAACPFYLLFSSKFCSVLKHATQVCLVLIWSCVLLKLFNPSCSFRVIQD